MEEKKQKVVNKLYGDCFPACMASLLELPVEVMPNDHSDSWWDVWRSFLGQFGLSIQSDHAKGAIWQSHPWIATVKSKNYKGGLHAIIMESSEVLFDPSTAKTYKKGQSLLGKDIVVAGYRILVSDFSKLHKLKEYRDKLTPKEDEHS